MGWREYIGVVMLSLSVISVSMVRSQRSGCVLERGALNQLNTCQSLLGLDGSAAPNPSSSCCSMLRAFENPSQAANCLLNALLNDAITIGVLNRGQIAGDIDGIMKICGITN